MTAPGSKEPRKSSRTPASEGGPRRVRTPLLMQMHATECGAACLGSVLAHFGRRVPLTELRGRCEISRDGSTAAGILRAARHYGLECVGWHGDVPALMKQPLPLILFWEFNHFLILEGFDGERFHLNDPAIGRRTLTAEEFGKGFSGVALRFGVGADFQPGGDPPGITQRLPQWLGGAGGAIGFAITCGLMPAVLRWSLRSRWVSSWTGCSGSASPGDGPWPE